MGTKAWSRMKATAETENPETSGNVEKDLQESRVRPGMRV